MARVLAPRAPWQARQGRPLYAATTAAAATGDSSAMVEAPWRLQRTRVLGGDAPSATVGVHRGFYYLDEVFIVGLEMGDRIRCQAALSVSRMRSACCRDVFRAACIGARRSHLQRRSAERKLRSIRNYYYYYYYYHYYCYYYYYYYYYHYHY